MFSTCTTCMQYFKLRNIYTTIKFKIKTKIKKPFIKLAINHSIIAQYLYVYNTKNRLSVKQTNSRARYTRYTPERDIQGQSKKGLHLATINRIRLDNQSITLVFIRIHKQQACNQKYVTHHIHLHRPNIIIISCYECQPSKTQNIEIKYLFKNIYIYIHTHTHTYIYTVEPLYNDSPKCTKIRSL